MADRYMAEGKIARNDRSRQSECRLYSRMADLFLRPLACSFLAGKAARLRQSLEAFLAHAQFWDSPIEMVHIPFEGSEIIAYLRLPKKRSGPVPLVIAINGLDSRKEDLAESFSAILPYGIGFLAVDGPGTGQKRRSR